jgi:hypothetical protein
MNMLQVRPLVVVLSVLVSLLAFVTGHLWRHADLPTALSATSVCLVAIVVASALAAGRRGELARG